MKQSLQKAMSAFHTGRVMVVGDMAIDEMVYGETARISREAPVLILHHTHTDILLGAGGNAAHNLAAMGAEKVTMIGLAGKDYHCSLLFEAMARDGVSADGMIQDASRPTITKTRISGQSRQSVLQQIVRIDRESVASISSEIEEQLIAQIETLAPTHQALIISDYKLGVVTPRVIAACVAAAKKHQLILSVDAHQDLRLFQGATIATPNLPEAEQNVGHSLVALADLEAGGEALRASAGLKNLLITRGSDGMSLFSESGDITHVPAFNKSEVFDVTGAGDTVISTLTLALATGATMLEAVLLGNLAASIVVKKYGTAVTHPDEMLAILDELDDALLPVKTGV